MDQLPDGVIFCPCVKETRGFNSAKEAALNTCDVENLSFSDFCRSLIFSILSFSSVAHSLNNFRKQFQEVKCFLVTFLHLLKFPVHLRVSCPLLDPTSLGKKVNGSRFSTLFLRTVGSARVLEVSPKFSHVLGSISTSDTNQTDRRRSTP